MLFLVVYLCLFLSTFPFPPAPASPDPSPTYFSIFSSAKPFYVVSDPTQYPADLLSSYKTSLSNAAERYNSLFDSKTRSWSDIGALTSASNLQKHINRVLAMAIAYQTEGTSLYQQASARENILAAFCYLSQYYLSSTTYNSDEYAWSLAIPNKLIDLLIVLHDIYSTAGKNEYYISLRLILGGLFTIPANSQLIRDCTGDSSKWYDDTKCSRSAIFIELCAAKIVIFSSLLVGDLSSMTKYYNRVSELLEAHDLDYDVAPQSILYDGFRTDGTFVEYYSSVIFGSTGQALLYLLSYILAPAKQIEEVLLSGKNPGDVVKITSQISTILQEIATYFTSTILPFVANCGVVDSLSGAEVALGVYSSHERLANIFSGLFQFVFVASSGGYSLPTSYKRIYKHCNYYILNCPQFRDFITSELSFPALGLWNKTTGVFLPSPTYPAELMLGHYPLIHGDHYAYQARNFSLIIAMNSNRTRNFQCINGLNKFGFYQAAGAVFPFVRDHPKQYDDYVLLASPHNYSGITYDSGYIPDCSSQTHLYGTLSPGRFVSSITDGTHGSATIDYYNARSNDIRYKTIYLMESLKEGLHVAQLTSTKTNSITLVTNLATVPFGNQDTIEVYIDRTKQTITGTYQFTGARRILFRIAPHTGSPYAAALIFPANLNGAIKNVTVRRTYTELGGTSTSHKTLYALIVTTTLQRVSPSSSGNQWQAFQPLMYSYYPHLPADITDDQLDGLMNSYTLFFNDGSQTGHTVDDSTGMLSYTQGGNKIIALNFYNPSTATLYGSANTVTSSATAQVLFVQTSKQYTITIRNPTSFTTTEIRLELNGFTDMASVQHWCTTGGSTGANNLYVVGRLSRTATCQIVVTRGASPAPLPSNIPPSTGRPPYVPPSKPLDDLLYDTSTDTIDILSPTENKRRADWMIAILVIVAVMLIAVCMAIGIWKCITIRRAFVHVKGELRKLEPINLPETITHLNTQELNVNLAQNQMSPRFNITNDYLALEEVIQISRAIDGSKSWTFENYRKQKPE
ncbi:Glycosaminoglycan polysaccharide lyase, putative [Giardia lamblia P15]|uniref:Glycosaminoglycan polysaccharide lyase, putative n=1 Tax=Giardia intestinalis (strain P15) TaxID=658858 RepID=E1EVV0_GIAIA|nr:Glycosaminoglycan polysaccharide lyase, putative [Giardia lamblia P15]